MKARHKRKEIDEEVMDLPDTDTTCSICYAEFLDSDDLKQHVTLVHLTDSSMKRFCKFCTVLFSNAEDFVLHIRDVHLSDMRYCGYCSRLFTDHAEHKKHEAKHYMFVQQSKYSCSQCKMLFSNIAELEQHEINKHPDGPGMFIQEYFPILSSVLNIKADTFLESLGKTSEYMCIKCEYTTEKVQDFISHLKTNGCQSYACSSCSFVFGKKKSLTYHFLTRKSCFADTNNETFKKQCRECLRYFDKKTLKFHQKSCKVIKCVSCNLVFDTITELSRHQSEKHPLAITLVQCSFCRRDFVGNVALNKHIDRAHKPKLHLYKYKCVHCGEMYKHPKKLLGHFYSRHKELEPYTCKICDKKFRIRKTFTLHIKLEHKSIGFVDYDEEYNIFFIDKKPEKQLKEKSDQTKEQEVIDAANAETECPSESQTDCPTDTDIEKKVKPVQTPKLRLKEEQKKKVLEQSGKDDMSNNDGDENTQKQKTTKRKRKQIPIDDSEMEVEALNSDSSDEPLLVVKKKAKLRKKAKLAHATGNRKSKPEINDARKRFTCTICKKYCFTFQNYHNHISMHYKSESKKCIKCGEEFKSKSQLQEHISTMHSSSKLTETLKNILDRKKHGISNPPKSNAERFMKTIKKVQLDDNTVANVTIKQKKDVLSVQNFIENFTPDERKKIDVTPVLTMKPVGFSYKEPLIKMTKFILKPEKPFTGLALPVKFKPSNEKHTVKVDFVVVEEKANSKINMGNDNDFMETSNYGNYLDDGNDHHDDDDIQGQDTNTIIPDVAQEVQLEHNVEKPVLKNVAHKIIIPDLPSGYNEICIAHLQPQAPYFKIVKMEKLLENREPKKEPVEDVDYTLPSGTKLVQANPFAHLMGEKELESMLEAQRNKYYKPKKKDFAKAIAKAMMDMDKKKPRPRKNKVSVEK